jgi:hypothetical protein
MVTEWIFPEHIHAVFGYWPLPPQELEHQLLNQAKTSA